MIKKNKILTYILVTALLIVWGLIIYRIVIAYSGNHDESYVPPPAPKEIFNDYALPKDTSHLLLNYRDPFGLAVEKDTLKPKRVRNPINFSRTNIATFNWGTIRYSGYIKNPASRKLIAFMHINGKEASMNEGETIDEVKLIRNLKDSVLVKRQGKTKYIHIQTAI